MRTPRRDSSDGGAVTDRSVLNVKDLSLIRTSDAAAVLSGVNLRVEAGEVVGLVGDSGAGKTVLMDAVLAMVSFKHELTGEIEVCGTSVESVDEKRLDEMRGREMAVIPSGGRHFLSPSTRVGKQMTRLLRRHFKMSRAEARIEAVQWLERVHIPDPARRMSAYPHELSGGMAQRVLIAMALMRKPRLVLADEPTAGLDVTIQKQVLDLLAELLEAQESACLLVTRDLGIVANYCNRVAVMERGAVVEDVPTASFFAGPTSENGRRMLDLVRNERLIDEELVAGADAVGRRSHNTSDLPGDNRAEVQR